MADKYETFVRWYLRFNGYFCVENFILHRPVGRSVLQDGEFDVLAVRFPYSRETKCGAGDIQNDPRLHLMNDVRIQTDVIDKPLIDFVIAEVKSGRTDLNEIWQAPDPQGEKVDRISYLLRWMGPLDSEDVINRVATEMHRKHWSVVNGCVFRLLQFCYEDRVDAQRASGPPQISFDSVAHWIVTSRTPCWRDLGLGARSAHDQWDPMIKEIWEIGNPKLQLTVEIRVNRIMALLERA